MMKAHMKLEIMFCNVLLYEQERGGPPLHTGMPCAGGHFAETQGSSGPPATSFHQST